MWVLTDVIDDTVVTVSTDVCVPSSDSFGETLLYVVDAAPAETAIVPARTHISARCSDVVRVHSPGVPPGFSVAVSAFVLRLYCSPRLLSHCRLARYCPTCPRVPHSPPQVLKAVTPDQY